MLPHPHVVEWDDAARGRGPRTPASSSGCTPRACGPTWTWRRWRRCWPTTVAGLPGARLQIDIHHEVFDPGCARLRPGRGGTAARARGEPRRVELREHDYFSDDELWDYLNALDVSVLPYRFGTHSGWLEACFDLGTAVVAPSCGFYAEQRPCLTYRHDETRLDAGSLAAAVRAAYEQSPAPRADACDAASRSAGRWPPRTSALYASLLG